MSASCLNVGIYFFWGIFLPSHAENFNIFPLLLVYLGTLLPNTLKVFRNLLLLTLILSLPKKRKTKFNRLSSRVRGACNLCATKKPN